MNTNKVKIGSKMVAKFAEDNSALLLIVAQITEDQFICRQATVRDASNIKIAEVFNAMEREGYNSNARLLTVSKNHTNALVLLPSEEA
jgi:hypothetical protein